MPNLIKTKIITLAITTTLFTLIPIDTYPIGIGNIKLKSRLNENLKAEIELRDSANEDISSIYVNLAPLEKFIKANVPWSSFLRSMKFRSVKGANGNIFVEVSSKEVVKEVFLNFIMEVGWNKGLLYREFTVLLDPPADYRATVISAVPQIQIKPVSNNWFQFPSSEASKKTNRLVASLKNNQLAI